VWWPEKIVILVVLSVIVFLLLLSHSFVPILENRTVSGPFYIPPCGFRISTGVPCPTCYMTRSFALMARGRILEAVWLQPMGALLWAIAAVSVPVLLVALFCPRPVTPVLERWPFRRIILALFLLTLAAWGYTIARELTIGPP
jgi:hypothetical protein